MKRNLIALFYALSIFTLPASAQSPTPEEPEANPARPTVSTPATLTPVGYLQFETGILGAWHSPQFSSRRAANEVIKLSVKPRLELLVSDEPIVFSVASGVHSIDSSDVFVGAQALLARAKKLRPAISISYLRHVYGGAAPDLDFGTPDNSFLLLASADVKGFHYDANVMLNELTRIPVRRLQSGQSLSISHPITAKFSLSGEIWHFTQPFLHAHAIGNLWALSYAARKTLIFDAGFNRGLTSSSTRWEAFAGFTYLLPHRLF